MEKMTTKICQTKKHRIFEAFPSANDLQATEKNVKCSQEGCAKTFVHNGALHMHLIKSHGLVKTDQDRFLYSSIKGKKFEDSCSFQYFCPAEKCIYKKGSNRFFTTFKLLKQHYQKVHAEKIYKCEKCPSAFGLERELRRHVEHCGILYKCGSCPVTYTTKETLQSHCNRKEHTFPEEYAVKNGNKQKQRASKTAPLSVAPVSEPKPMPVAVLILGLPAPLKDQPKLHKAILPKDIQETIQGKKVSKIESVETPSKETETPFRQHAVIQTEIYGVENLAVEGREIQTTAGVSGPKPDKSMMKPVLKTAKGKLKTDKENLSVTRNKKSSTGMQTSVSLFPRKRLKTVTGTQTSGDYILKKAMASADIPIQRKTVASQVTPQKPGAKLPRKRATCSSETQTGISPEKKSKDDADIHSTNGPVENILQSSKEIELGENLSESLSTSTQTLQSYIESLRDKQVEVNIALSPSGNLIISPSKPCEIQKRDLTLNKSSDQPSPENSNSPREQDKTSTPITNITVTVSKDSNTAAPKADDKVPSNLTPTFIESLGLKPAKTQAFTSKKRSTVSADSFDTASTRKIYKKHNDLDSYAQMIHHDNTGLNTHSKQNFANATRAVARSKGKAVKPKRSKTIRNLLSESEKNSVPVSESTPPSYRPLISTTSGITFNSSLVTYSNAQALQTVTTSPAKVALSSLDAANKHVTQPIYDSHKLFNPIQDQMLGGRTNDNSNTIDMEAQAMSASEFEQLLLASGLLLEVSSQSEHVISDFGYQNPATNLHNADIETGNQTVGLVHKEMATETLTGPEFDFLNESSSTIDMNTQTITDFGSLLGPMDSDTQTVADIDFLDLVMTNMETQTLSDQDLIDLGLMDPNQATVKPFDVEMDYLKTSETQTSLVAQVESATSCGSNQNGSVDVNVNHLAKNMNRAVSEILTEKVNNATPSTLTNQCDDRNAMINNVSDNLNLIKAVNIAKPQEATESKHNDQSEDFQTTNMETQTAFDELKKLISQ